MDSVLDKIPNFKKNKINKVPGAKMTIKEQDKKVKDLTVLTSLELLDLKCRQESLLRQKEQLLSLRDKGKRIKEFHSAIMKEVERRTNVDEVTTQFSNLNINTNETDVLNVLKTDLPETTFDSDDEMEIDLKECPAKEQNEVYVTSFEQELSSDNELKSTESNIIDSDLIVVNIQDKMAKLKANMKKISKNSNENVKNSSCQYSEYLIKKTENDAKPLREKFKPFQTTRTNVHDPRKEKQRKLGKYWEVTAATPPPIQHNGVQMISLVDSVRLQSEYIEKMRIIQEEQAAKRLALRLERLKQRLEAPDADMIKNSPAFTSYRCQSQNIEGSPSLDLDSDDCIDEEDKEKGVVTITVLK